MKLTCIFERIGKIDVLCDFGEENCIFDQCEAEEYGLSDFNKLKECES